MKPIKESIIGRRGVSPGGIPVLRDGDIVHVKYNDTYYIVIEDSSILRYLPSYKVYPESTLASFSDDFDPEYNYMLLSSYDNDLNHIGHEHRRLPELDILEVWRVNRGRKMWDNRKEKIVQQLRRKNLLFLINDSGLYTKIYQR